LIIFKFQRIIYDKFGSGGPHKQHTVATWEDGI